MNYLSPDSGILPLDLAPHSANINESGKTSVSRLYSLGYQTAGKIAGKPWRLACTQPTREFISGGELFATAKLDLPLDLSILVISRSLRESLEKKAFTTYTNSVRTALDSALSEEMQWLATHQEVGWEGLPWAFLGLYAIMTVHPQQPRKWLTANLAEKMVEWVDGASFLKAETPFILTLMRGRVALRMQLDPADRARFAHATDIFIEASAAAMDGFLPDIEI